MAHLPMPKPTIDPKPSLTSFKTLSFDIYGTLINWEASIVKNFAPLVSELPSSHQHKHISADDLAALFHHHEAPILKADPATKYSELIAKVYLRIAEDWGLDPTSPKIVQQSHVFGASISSWIPYPDTVDAMQRLGKFYRLIPLSNVDRTSFQGALSGSLKDVPFWKYYVAEDIGSYKPDLNNFRYLLQHLDEDDRKEGGDGVRKDQDLHVAQSLVHDHEPAKKIGLNSVWIARKGAGYGGQGGKEDVATGLHEKGLVGYGWRFRTLGDFAAEIERVWTEEGKEPRFA